MFVRQDWKKLSKDKHSSLLQKAVNYGQKSFIRLSPGWRRSSLRRAPPRGRRSGGEDCRWRPEKGLEFLRPGANVIKLFTDVSHAFS